MEREEEKAGKEEKAGEEEKEGEEEKAGEEGLTRKRDLLTLNAVLISSDRTSWSKGSMSI